MGEETLGETKVVVAEVGRTVLWDFDQILAESEQESVQHMALVDELSRQNELSDMRDSGLKESGLREVPGSTNKIDKDGVLLVDITDQTGSGRYGKSRVSAHVQRKRNRDKRELSGKWMGQKSALDLKACDMESVRLLMGYVEHKPHWAVDACVVLRDQGSCVVCKEPVGKGYVVRMVVPKARDGEYTEDNCVCVCKHCGECWFMHKDFNVGFGRVDTLDRLSVAVMERRRKRFHGVKDLNDLGVERLRELRRKTEDKKRRELAASDIVKVRMSE